MRLTMNTEQKIPQKITLLNLCFNVDTLILYWSLRNNFPACKLYP